jgi:hypothetical protein
VLSTLAVLGKHAEKKSEKSVSMQILRQSPPTCISPEPFSYAYFGRKQFKLEAINERSHAEAQRTQRDSEEFGTLIFADKH